MNLHSSKLFLGALLLGAAALIAAPRSRAAELNEPPAGFTAVFNGKDLTGFRGGSTFDPRKLAAMSDEARAAQIAKWTETMRAHWRVENGELINDGKGDYATTEKDYGDIELLVDYKTVPLGDSGVYLRGCPQVQIWDSTEQAKFKLGADKGSGGLWNNSPGAPGKDPLVLADKPFGEWNHLRVIMVGARVSVWLNEKLVVDHAILENYYDRKTPVPRAGPLELQTHGGEIRWRNYFVREIGSDEANRILESHGTEGFKSIFNGKDLDNWGGNLDSAKVENGAIVWQQKKGGTLYEKEELTDFVARVEFKLPPAGNNGLAIRYPGTGDTAYVGMCEVQVLDDPNPAYAKIDPRQACGSVYGMVAAQRGYLRPVGEWNFYEVTVKGPSIHVELNGNGITDADVSKITPDMFMANHPHPGKDRTSGFFGFTGHNDPVEFRNVSIKELPSAAAESGGASGAPAKASQTCVEILSEQAPNALEWALAPLSRSTPPDIRRNLTLLREDLLDEGAKKPQASTGTYKLGSELCNLLIGALDERDKLLVRAGYTAVQARANMGEITNQALEARRRFTNWPTYQREKDQRGEVRKEKENAAELEKQRPVLEWAARGDEIRRMADALYTRYRDAARQPVSVK